VGRKQLVHGRVGRGAAGRAGRVLHGDRVSRRVSVCVCVCLCVCMCASHRTPSAMTDAFRKVPLHGRVVQGTAERRRSGDHGSPGAERNLHVRLHLVLVQIARADWIRSDKIRSDAHCRPVPSRAPLTRVRAGARSCGTSGTGRGAWSTIQAPPPPSLLY